MLNLSLFISVTVNTVWMAYHWQLYIFLACLLKLFNFLSADFQSNIFYEWNLPTNKAEMVVMYGSFNCISHSKWSNLTNMHLICLIWLGILKCAHITKEELKGFKDKNMTMLLHESQSPWKSLVCKILLGRLCMVVCLYAWIQHCLLKKNVEMQLKVRTL